MRRQLRGRPGVRFAVEHLESRRLLAYADVLVGTSLQAAEFDHTSPITVLPGQPVTFDVEVQGYAGDGSPVPIPTGRVTLYFQGDPTGVTVLPLTLSGGTEANGLAKVDVSGTLTMNQAEAAGFTNVNGTPQNFVYAEYFGDANYADTPSTPGLTGPSPNGNVVTVNFAPTHFAFTQQPSDAPANSAVAPPITVALQDGNGAVDPYYTGTDAVTLLVATGPTGGTFVAPASSDSGESLTRNDRGTYLTAYAVNGVATFPDVELSAAGTYTLGAGAQTFFASATSNAFNVIAGDRLAFGQAPTDGTAKKPIRPPVTVKVEDAAGNVKADDDATVVTLATVGFTGDAPVTGNTATAVHGVATFPDLTLTTPGFYQLQATDARSDAAATSAKFKVVGDHLKVTRQPPAANDGGAAIPVTVQLLDADDKLDAAATTYALLSLNVVAPGTRAVLGGTVAAPFVGGVATFPAAAGPTVDAAGTYTFTATEANLEQSTNAYLPTNTSTAVDTAPFKVAGAHLAVLHQPGKVTVGEPVMLTLAYENARGKVVATQNGAGVTLSLAPAATANAGAAAAVLGGTVAVNFVHGIARFTARAGPTVSLPGDYTLTAVDPASPAVAADVSKPFTVVGYHLVVRKQPTTADADEPIPITVALLDGKNRVVTAESTAAVTLTYKTLSGGVDAVQTGTLVKTLSGGVAAFTAAAAPAFDRAGVFQFTATETGTAAVGTVASTQTVDAKPIRVRGDHLVFTPGPTNASVDDSLEVSVARVDSKGRRVTGSDSVFKTFASLSLTPVTGGAGATLTNPSTELASGLATFKGLSVNRPGTYTLTAVRQDGQGQTEADTLPVTSKPFKVTGLHVVAQLQPKADLLPYEPMPLRFALVDAKGKVDANASNYDLNLALTPTHGGTGAKLQSVFGTFPFANGVADLTTDGAIVQHDENGTLLTSRVSVSDNPGTFVLDASATTGDPAAVTPEAGQTRPFRIVPLHLAVQRAAATVVQYGAIPTQVALVDPNGRVDTFDSITKAAVTLNGPAGSLVNGAGHTFTAGVADLGVAGGVGVDLPGTYTLTIGPSLEGVGTSTPATAPVTTAPFQVTPVSVAITTQPANAAVNGTTPFAVGLVDATGARVTMLATILTAELTRQPAGDTLPGVLLALGAAFQPDGDVIQTGTVDTGDVPGTYTIVVTLRAVTDGPPIGSPVVSTPFVVG